MVALTFDDGPHPKWTPKLLDILKEENVLATFFVVGRNARAHPEVVRRMANDGHEVGNHTWSHPSLAEVGQERLDEEIIATSNVIARLTGKLPRIMRPPYGALNNQARERIYSHNLDIVLWSVDPLDWRRPGSAIVSKRMVEGAAPGAIILAHDIHGGTVDAIGRTIRELKARGYRFVTVSDLASMRDDSTKENAVAAKH